MKIRNKIAEKGEEIRSRNQKLNEFKKAPKHKKVRYTSVEHFIIDENIKPSKGV